jgi:hypothetical protein
MVAQRFGDRQWRKRLAGLPRNYSDHALGGVDLVPGERCQVNQPLAGVETEFDKALPFGVGNSHDCL